MEKKEVNIVKTEHLTNSNNKIFLMLKEFQI